MWNIMTDPFTNFNGYTGVGFKKLMSNYIPLFMWMCLFTHVLNYMALHQQASGDTPNVFLK